MKFYNFMEYDEKKQLSKIKKILSNKRSSQTPTVIKNFYDNEEWLFFFKNNRLKSLWIHDYTKDIWFEHQIYLDIISACLYKNNIYLSDSKGNIYIKKTGSYFASC